MKYFITNQKALYSYTDFNLVEIDRVKEFIKKSKENNYPICLDIETTGLDPKIDEILLIQVGNKKLDEWYVIDCTTIPKVKLIEILKDLEEILCIIHNAKFEQMFLYQKLGVYLFLVYCTMLGEQLTKNNLPETRIKYPKGEGGYYSLEKVCLRHKGIKLDKKLQKSFIGKVNNIPFTEGQLIYALDDIIHLEDVKDNQQLLIDKLSLHNLIKLENKVVGVLAKMELDGIPFNEFLWYKNAEENKPKLAKAIDDLDSYLISNIHKFPQLIKYVNNQTSLFEDTQSRKAKINWGSETQVIPVFELLEPNLSLDYYDSKSDKTKKSVGKDQIKQYKNRSEFVKLLLEFSLYDKAVNTYGSHWVDDNQHEITKRIHPKFNQLGTITGRITEDHPNCLQIPSNEKYRQCFMTNEGWKIISIDYSQAEQRIVANNSNDPILLDVFHNNKDPYCVSGEIMFNIPVSKTVNSDKRKVAKAVVLGKNFGIGGSKLAKKIREEGLECDDKSGSDFISLFDSSFPVLTDFNNKQNKLGIKNRYAKTLDMFNRICWFDPNPNLSGKLLAKIGRNSQNQNCQGGNANLIKLALILISDWLREYNKEEVKARLVNVIYDELTIEVKEEHSEEVAEKAKELMIKAGTYICKKVVMDATYVIDNCWVKD